MIALIFLVKMPIGHNFFVYKVKKGSNGLGRHYRPNPSFTTFLANDGLSFLL